MLSKDCPAGLATGTSLCSTTVSHMNDTPSGWPRELRNASVVGLGAAIGASARFLLPDNPLTLLLINTSGALATGLFQPGLFWGMGILGGFTSLSAFIAAPQSLPYAAATITVTIGGWLLADRIRTWTHS